MPYSVIGKVNINMFMRISFGALLILHNEMRMNRYVLTRLKVTDHFFVNILFMSKFRSSAEVSQLSTTIYKLLSSAIRRIFDPISTTMSLKG